MRRMVAIAVVVVASVVNWANAPVQPASAITTPRAMWNHDVGDDDFVLSYTEIVEYWRRLSHESRRLRIVDIGSTTAGTRQYMAIITSAANGDRLAAFQAISRRLMKGEGLDDATARTLARQGKAVVWIDGGLHSNEILGSQQLAELTYRLVSGNDEEISRILDNVIILAVVANPDGMELMSRWYRAFGNTETPVMYHPYAGHDINRDFYMTSLQETANMARILYREWCPQVVYDHHQSSPPGTVMFAPPFMDPFNYYLHPYIPAALDLLGGALATRFIAEGKPGVTSREAAPYSTWFNGALRTTSYFHNQIGLLTETMGAPRPVPIQPSASSTLPKSSLFWPIGARDAWHMRDSIEYSMTANWAVLDYAARYREHLLFSVYRMARDQIAWGREDHWTPSPHVFDRVEGVFSNTSAATTLDRRAPIQRDARGYVLPVDQRDFGTATRFIATLMRSGVDVHRTVTPFAAEGRTFAPGSYVVKTAQAYRAHILDMFEPQDYPGEGQPGGPQYARPYDGAGYTLAFQMGVEFVRLVEPFDGAFEVVSERDVQTRRREPPTIGTFGIDLDHAPNDSFILVNRLLRAGCDVRWLPDGHFGPGTLRLMPCPQLQATVTAASESLDIRSQPANKIDGGTGALLHVPRIAVYDTVGGQTGAGWARLVLEQFEFPYRMIYPSDLTDGDDLNAQLDVILSNEGDIVPFPSNAPAPARGTSRILDGQPLLTRPPALSDIDGLAAFATRRAGTVSPETFNALVKFISHGGSLIVIGRGAAAVPPRFELPLDDYLASVPSEEYTVPRSIVRVAIDGSVPVAHGLPAEIDIPFSNSPVFKAAAAASATGVRKVAWISRTASLRSGWARGIERLVNGMTFLEASVGKGTLFISGPPILNRDQSHGAFKLIFNALLLSALPDRDRQGLGTGTRTP